MRLLWTQKLEKQVELLHSDWAISFSWWGKSKSTPPPWISILDPNNLFDIAEHSICHPGLPYPHGDVQPGSLPEDGFHKTKSRGFFLSSFTLTLYPANKSSVFFPDSFPYSLNFSIEKKTLPELS